MLEKSPNSDGSGQPGRRTRSLRQQIDRASQSAKNSRGLAPTCALTKAGCSCEQRGFTIYAHGAIVKARVCTCIEQCPACFGSNRRLEDGEAKVCRTPAPSRIVSNFNQSEIPSRYIEASFASFRNQTGNCARVLNEVLRWSNTFKAIGGTGLILSGGVGVGKTYLLVALAKEFLQRGLTVRFVDFHRLLSVIRAAYTDRRSEQTILGPLIDADVLIVDELGKGRNNDWEQEKLDQIVMGRYNQNKVIIASTNYTLKAGGSKNPYNVDLEQELYPKASQFNPDVFESLETRVGQRVFSRLFETSLLLEMEGDDYRRQRASTSSPRPPENLGRGR